MAAPLTEATVITILSTSGRPILITGSAIQLPVQIQSSLATVPVFIASGSVSAVLQGIGSVSIVGTPTVSASILGTPTVTASIPGTPTVSVIGTPTVSASILGTPTVSQQPVSYAYTQTGVATIKATAGTLYEAIITGEAGLVAAAGTAVLLNSIGTIAVLAVPAGDMRQASFSPGVSFGTLIASIIGTVDLTVAYQ